MPPVAARLDPSRHLALQGQVQRLRDVITQQEITVSQMITPSGDDAGMVARQRKAQEQARADLDAMREALTQAKADLAAFEAGRLT